MQKNIYLILKKNLKTPKQIMMLSFTTNPMSFKAAK